MGGGGGSGGSRGVPAGRRPLTEGGGPPAGQRGAARLNPGRAGPGSRSSSRLPARSPLRTPPQLNAGQSARRGGPTLPRRPLGAAPGAVPPARSRPRSRLLCASEGCRLSLPAANLHLNRRPAEGRRGRAAAAAEGNSQPAGGSGAPPQVPNPRRGARRTSLAERALNHGPRGHVQPPNGKGRVVKAGSTWREVSRGTKGQWASS